MTLLRKLDLICLPIAVLVVFAATQVQGHSPSDEMDSGEVRQVMSDIRQLFEIQSESHTGRNTNKSMEESAQLMKRMMNLHMSDPRAKAGLQHVRQRLQAESRVESLHTRSADHDRKFLLGGDSSKCYTGSCEFFLMCWLTGGLVEKGCGGFLFACCQRNGYGHSSSAGLTPATAFADQQAHPLVDYGPVRSDGYCGAVNQFQAQRRIVGGEDAGFGNFPWQAYVRIGSSRCGGSLLNNNYVLTAGHCVAKANPEQIKITLGEYTLNSDAEPLRPITLGVSEIHVHPYFKFTPQADRFDVAVLRLEYPVAYEPHISPICLPEKGEDFLGQFAWVAGWGAMQAGSRVRPKTLQVVDVPVIDNRQCEGWHKSKGINVVIYDEMMCSGYRYGGKDSCQGDSGGPLALEENGRWYQIGIVSAGYSCAQPGQPGIYHRVSYTADWISSIAF